MATRCLGLLTTAALSCCCTQSPADEISADKFMGCWRVLTAGLPAEKQPKICFGANDTWLQIDPATPHFPAGERMCGQFHIEQGRIKMHVKSLDGVVALSPSVQKQVNIMSPDCQLRYTGERTLDFDCSDGYSMKLIGDVVGVTDPASTPVCP
jgi:hypothetical protein